MKNKKTIQTQVEELRGMSKDKSFGYFDRDGIKSVIHALEWVIGDDLLKPSRKVELESQGMRS